MALAVGALIAASASAAPLCRDLKGLFTPCPQGLNKTAQHKLEQRIEALPAEPPSGAASSYPRSASRAAKPHVAAESRFAKGKLCRDTKGLFTPCAR